MGIIRALALSATVSAVGCATTPPPERGYSAVTQDIILASAQIESIAPATLPLDPDLSGKHDESFYVQIALERNPLVLAARRDVAATVQTIPQVTALEDPVLSEKFWPASTYSPQTAMGRMTSSLSLSQEFPWPDKLRVRGEVAEQEAKMALSRLAAEELATVEEVRLAYFDLYFYGRAMEVTRENGELLEDLIAFAEARYRTGGSQQDVIRIQVERDRLDNRLIEYEQQLTQTQADLAALLHASPEIEPLAAESVQLPPVPEMLDGLYELAARCRPELKERLHQIVRDQRRRELARLAYIPDLATGVDWDVMTTDEAISPVADGNDNFGIRLGINLPIYRDRLQAGVKEAEHRTVESARRYDAERDNTFRQIRRLSAVAGAKERQLSLYREQIVPRTRQALEVSIADYRTGRGDILQVVDNYTELLTFEIQIARFEADLGQALASLERIVGCELAASQAAVTKDVPPAPEPAVDAEEAEDVSPAEPAFNDLPR